MRFDFLVSFVNTITYKINSMKTSRKLSFLLIGLISLSVIFNSCRKDDDESENKSASGPHLSAKVNGSEYKSYVDPTGVAAGGMLVIQSSDTSGNSIQIQIANYNGKGTYNSGGNNLTKGYINYMKMISIGNMKTYTSVRGTGKVEITEASATEVKGTFTATAFENVSGSTDKVDITEGTFTAKIQ